MAQSDTRIKQLNIKTGVVKRTTKEKEGYEKEAIQLEQRLGKMKTDGKDEHDIKKQGEVLQESRSMIPDTIRRLKKACADLQDLLDNEPDLSGTEEYTKAKDALSVAAEVIA